MTSIAVGIVCFVLIIFRKDKNKEYKEYYNIENLETVQSTIKQMDLVVLYFQNMKKINMNCFNYLKCVIIIKLKG